MTQKTRFLLLDVLLPLVIGLAAGVFVVLAYTFISGRWEWATVWTATQAVATMLAFIAAVVLWRETAKQRETELMLRLVGEYDALRNRIALVSSYWWWCATHGVADPAMHLARSRDSMSWEYESEGAEAVDDARFEVSRFFVRIRKLVRAGYLSQSVVLNSIDRRSVELFLDVIDPLDRAVAEENYSAEDRNFFSDLLAHYSQGKS